MPYIYIYRSPNVALWYPYVCEMSNVAEAACASAAGPCAVAEPAVSRDSGDQCMPQGSSLRPSLAQFALAIAALFLALLLAGTSIGLVPFGSEPCTGNCDLDRLAADIERRLSDPSYRAEPPRQRLSRKQRKEQEKARTQREQERRGGGGRSGR
jgi:hypothetical protein